MLRHQPLTLLITLATVALSVYLYIVVPKGFFPQQDTGRHRRRSRRSRTFHSPPCSEKLTQFVTIVMKDPAVENVVGFAGGNTATNQGRMFITLKPLNERKITADQVIAGCAASWRACPARRCFCRRRRTCRSADAWATRNTNTRCRPRIWMT